MQLTASPPVAADKAMATLGAYGFVREETIKHRGIPYAAGTPTAKKVTRGRIAGFASRLKRIRAFARAQVRVGARIARTAGNPAMIHACEVSGISTAHLNTSRKVNHSACTPGNNSVCTTTALLLNRTEKLDPSFTAHENPILKWASAVAGRMSGQVSF